MSARTQEAALRARIRELEEQLERAQESEEVLRAIQAGEVDAIVVEGAFGPEPYTLRTADQPYRILVQEMGEGALVLSGSGRVLFENAAAKRQAGGSLVGQLIGDAFAVDDRPRITAMLERGGGTLDATLQRREEALSVRLTASPMIHDGSHRFALIFSDLSEHNRLVAYKAANEAKTLFLSLLGHEIRNPLTSIRTALTVLSAKPTVDIDVKMRGVITRQVTQIAALVDDLLDLTRIDSGKLNVTLERIDLVPLLRRTGETQVVTANDQGVEFHVTIPEEPIWVDADPIRLQQIIDNLLSNAYAAAGNGGRVSVNVTCCDDGNVVIAVEDNGPGVAPVEHAQIFEPFAQLNAGNHQKGGLGLGLPLARGLTEAQGGELGVRSDGEGSGAVFEVRLPLRSAPREFATAEHVAIEAEHDGPRDDEPGTRSRLRILLVEDNVDAREGMRLLLGAYGYEVDAAGDVVTALEQVRTRSYDVVLSDIGLPDDSGIELARQIRDSTGFEGTLAALTGYADDDTHAELLSAGFVTRFAKPVDIEQLRKFLAGVPAVGSVGP